MPILGTCNNWFESSLSMSWRGRSLFSTIFQAYYRLKCGLKNSSENAVVSKELSHHDTRKLKSTSPVEVVSVKVNIPYKCLLEARSVSNSKKKKEAETRRLYILNSTEHKSTNELASKG
jgi:hypothetical protein